MDFRFRPLRLAVPLVALAFRSEAQGIRGVTRRTPTVVHGQTASQFFAAGGLPLNAPTNVGMIPGSPQGSTVPGLAQQGRPLSAGAATPHGNLQKVPPGTPFPAPIRSPANAATRPFPGSPISPRSATPPRTAAPAPAATPAGKPAPSPVTR